MNQGKFIFSQIVGYIPRYPFDKLVRQYKGDWHSKNLSSYNHLLHLLFGQLTGCDSLLDICLCLEAHSGMLYHLGFRNTVNHTSLSRANENRDYRIFEGLGLYLIDLVRPLYSKTKLSDVTVDNVVYALDSTTISTSIKLATWAYGKYSRGAVKMHTLLDLRGSIPAHIHITDGKWHDSNELDVLEPESFAFYVMEKAYTDFKALYRFHLAEAFWVSRPKENMRFTTLEQIAVPAAEKSIIEDARIKVRGYKSASFYHEEMRLIRVYDADNDDIVSFISNNFDVSATTIANLYRYRWDIEVFFKWIKLCRFIRLESRIFRGQTVIHLPDHQDSRQDGHYIHPRRWWFSKYYHNGNPKDGKLRPPCLRECPFSLPSFQFQVWTLLALPHCSCDCNISKI